MKALILSAGRGRRLWPFTADCPKCLLPIGRVTILERQLYNLEQVGISEVVLVCGFGADRVYKAVEASSSNLNIKLLYNPFYAISDNLISLWVARSEMDRDFVLLNGDNVFHPGIVQRLLSVEETCCLMIDRKTSYSGDDMKIQVLNDRIIRIGKSLSGVATDAASIGILRFSGECVGLIRQMLEEIVVEEKALGSYFPDSIQRLIAQGHPVTYREVDGLPWADIDTPEDLRAVRNQVHLYQADPVLRCEAPIYTAAKGGA